MQRFSSRELTLCLLQRRLGGRKFIRNLRHLTTKLLEFGTSLTLSSRRSGTGSDKLLLCRLCCSLEVLEFGAQRLLTFLCSCKLRLRRIELCLSGSQLLSCLGQAGGGSRKLILRCCLTFGGSCRGRLELLNTCRPRRQISLKCSKVLGRGARRCGELLLSSRELTLRLLQRRLGNSELLRSLRHLTTKLLKFGTSLTLSSRRSGTGSDKLLLRRLCCSLELLEFGAQLLLTLFACDCYSFKFGHASLPSCNICDSWVCNSWQWRV